MNHEKIVRLVKAAKGANGLTDLDIAKKVGLHRNLVNLYLNRRIDLIPQDVERLLQALELGEYLPRLSAPATFTAGAAE